MNLRLPCNTWIGPEVAQLEPVGHDRIKEQDSLARSFMKIETYITEDSKRFQSSLGPKNVFD